MSGRLILLPKKSYTPWNAKNIERVLKDERIAQEEEEKERRGIEEIQSRHRIHGMKAHKRKLEQQADEDERDKERPEQLKHVKLFELEEHHMILKSLNEDNQEESKGCSVPRRREYLHRRTVLTPFYLQAQTQPASQLLHARDLTSQDTHTKAYHDPMKMFQQQNASNNSDICIRGNQILPSPSKSDNIQIDKKTFDNSRKRTKHRKHRYEKNDADVNNMMEGENTSISSSSSSFTSSSSSSSNHDTRQKRRETKRSKSKRDSKDEKKAKSKHKHTSGTKASIESSRRTIQINNDPSGSDIKSSDVSLQIAALRLRRQLREQHEASREKLILQKQNEARKNRHHFLGDEDRQRSYQDQYNPNPRGR